MRGLRKYTLLSLLYGLLPLIAEGQQLTEKLIVKDPGDSLYLKAFRAAFDTNGNYYFETLLKGKSAKFGMFTNKKKYNPVYTGSAIATAPYKSLVADAFFSDTTHKKIYYKNKNGTRIYGPHAGKIREVLEYGRENIAMELCIGAQSYLYINDSLVNTTDSLRQNWLCYFSENGNVIYSVYKKNEYKLYLNYKLIDSSAEQFIDIAVNNNLFYVYAKAEKGRFYIHTPKNTFGPVGAIDYSDVWNSNAYYFRGCADSQCYVLVNDILYSQIPEAHTYLEDPASGNLVYKSDEIISVEPVDAANYLFAYNQHNDNGSFLNINSTIAHNDYFFSSLISYDKKLGYAYYGTRYDSVINGERTFKNINGKEHKLPFLKSKEPNRLHTLTINPDGSSLYYFETQDSVYIYSNDVLLCKPASRKKFLTWDATTLPQTHPEGTDYFMGMNVEGNTYIAYNNTISKPMPLIYPEYNRLDELRKGSLMAGDISSKGFFVIYCTAKGKYLLNINNKIYKELENIDNIFGEASYFTSNAVIFYGVKGNSFYEFRVGY